MIQISSQR
ncbi:hypothetical protein LINPERPRIM_LOCUS12950 [Linum perenne]